MKKSILLLLSVVYLCSCSSDSKTEDKTTQNTELKDSAFKQFEERFVNEFWKIYPGWATSVGNHIYDTVLIIPNEASRTAELNFCKAYLDSLNQFNEGLLNGNNNIDKTLIKNNYSREDLTKYTYSFIEKDDLQASAERIVTHQVNKFKDLLLGSYSGDNTSLIYVEV